MKNNSIASNNVPETHMGRALCSNFRILASKQFQIRLFEKFTRYCCYYNWHSVKSKKLRRIIYTGDQLVKVAVISLTCKQDEHAPSAVLEHELWENLIQNDKISGKWKIEKVTILDDTELIHGGRPRDQAFNINRSSSRSRVNR